ncbi:MAG: hypothetical protein LBV60_15550 [Streptomyces sp.]|jgi:hypothetical protein|nr:hypothetical protein [Streptomyces sp.]
MFAQPTAPGKPTAEPGPGDVIAQQIRNLIIDTANNAPRSRQRRIGPSEVGNPCDRALAYKSLDWPTAPGADREPWASVQGTAIHTWMAELFEQRDPTGERYLVEQRVTVHQGYTEDATIAGSADLYDRLTGTVYDWKAVSPNSLAKYQRHGPGDQYRIQANLYGLGMENAGETPKRVAIVFLPRQYRLEPYVWVDEYRRDVALAAVERLLQIRTRLSAVDLEAEPARFAEFATSPDAKCFFCDWHQRGTADLGKSCPGHTP